MPTTNSITKLLILILMLLTPFSYVEAGGFRLVLLQAIIAALLWCICARKKEKTSLILGINILFLVFFAIYAFVASLDTQNFNFFFALSVFFLIAYWPIFFSMDQHSFERMVSLYSKAALVTAVLLITQFALSRYYNYDIFYHEEFGGGRSAYGFIWTDYSFLSLYLTSAIPLFYTRTNRSVFFLCTTVLLIASIITSARTGITAFFIFYSLRISLKNAFHLLSGILVKKYFFSMLLIPALPFAYYFSIKALTGRTLTTSSSGRIEDFIAGWNFFLDNYFFGALFDTISFSESIATIPHNVFIYMLYMGGIVAFLIFIMWGITLALSILKSDKTIISSLTICFVGFQFIPSFFSAYFFSVLLSMAIISAKLNGIK